MVFLSCIDISSLVDVRMLLLLFFFFFFFFRAPKTDAPGCTAAI
jgi:hypothetical protein